MDKKNFGGKFGSKTNREPIRMDFFPFWGSLGVIFQKNPKMGVFQILNFPEALSQLPLDLESSNFFGRLLHYAEQNVEYHFGWFGLV